MPIENVTQSEGYRFLYKYLSNSIDSIQQDCAGYDIYETHERLLLNLVKLAYLEGHIDANKEQIKKQVIDNGLD